MDNENKKEIPGVEPQRRPDEIPQQRPQEVPEIKEGEKADEMHKEGSQKKWSDISDPEIGDGVC